MERSAEVEATLAELIDSTDPAELRRLFEAATPEALASRPGPNEWSAVQIIRHLGDTEEIRHMRFDRMLAEENPIIDRPELPPGERSTEDGLALLSRYERLRARAVERLSAMTETDWRRVGTQLPDPQVNRTVPSPTSVLNESQKILRHSADHLQQIQANLAAYRAATPAER
jgi:hypothetical protein